MSETVSDRDQLLDACDLYVPFTPDERHRKGGEAKEKGRNLNARVDDEPAFRRR